MIRQLFRVVAIVLFIVVIFMAFPTSVDAAGFFNRNQEVQQSEQNFQEDRYTQQDRYVQEDRYSQEEQTYSAQDSEPSYFSTQSNQLDHNSQQD